MHRQAQVVGCHWIRKNVLVFVVASFVRLTRVLKERTVDLVISNRNIKMSCSNISGGIIQFFRETLDNTVMETAQSRISELTKNQSMLEECWRPLRWLHDAVTAGRDPSGSAGGVSLTQLKKWTANNGGGGSTLPPSTPLPEQRLSSQSHKVDTI